MLGAPLALFTPPNVPELPPRWAPLDDEAAEFLELPRERSSSTAGWAGRGPPSASASTPLGRHAATGTLVDFSKMWPGVSVLKHLMPVSSVDRLAHGVRRDPCTGAGGSGRLSPPPGSPVTASGLDHIAAPIPSAPCRRVMLVMARPQGGPLQVLTVPGTRVRAAGGLPRALRDKRLGARALEAEDGQLRLSYIRGGGRGNCRTKGCALAKP